MQDRARRGRPAARGRAAPRPTPRPSATSPSGAPAGCSATCASRSPTPPRSCHPERLVRGARSVIAAALPLWRPARRAPAGPVGRLPRYAWSDPYAAAARAAGGAGRAAARASTARARAVFVDSNHHVDREAAVRAGLAFYGKNTLAIVPGQGSFVALGAIVTDAELEPAEELVPPGCGSCTLCLDACPTGALVEPGVLDATALHLDHDAGARARCPSPTPRRSRTGSTAATSARTSAPGTPARRSRGAELEPEGEAWVDAGRLARAAGRRAAARATSASTCRAATRATCAATPWSRWATCAAAAAASSRAVRRRRRRAAAPRRARARSDGEERRPVALGARRHGAAEGDVVCADAEVARPRPAPDGPAGASAASQRARLGNRRARASRTKCGSRGSCTASWTATSSASE